MTPRLWAALAAAMLLHAALIVAARVTWTSGAVATAPHVLTVRYLQAAPVRPPSLVPVEPTPASATAMPAVPDTSASPAPLREPALHVATPGASTQSAASSPTVAAAGAPARRAEPVPAEGQPGLPPAPDYLVGAMLDPRPQPIGDIEPLYPDSANLQEGTVVLRLLISDAGHVDDVGVVRSEPKGVFEDAAIEAFAKAGFTPGRAAGVAVKSQITIEVHFIPINRGARISGRTY